MVVLNNAAGRASPKSNWVLNALGSDQLNAVFGRFADGDVHRFFGGQTSVLQRGFARALAGAPTLHTRFLWASPVTGSGTQNALSKGGF